MTTTLAHTFCVQRHFNMHHNYSPFDESHSSEDREQYRLPRHLSFLHVDAIVKGTEPGVEHDPWSDVVPVTGKILGKSCMFLHPMAQLNHCICGAQLSPQSTFLAIQITPKQEVNWITKSSCTYVWPDFSDLTGRQVLKSVSALVILSCVKPIH